MFVLLIMLILAPAPAELQEQPPGSAPVSEPIDADRPHVGTGTHVVSPGEVQFELGGQWQRSGDLHTFASPALMRIGISERVEARVASDGLLMREATLPFPVVLGTFVISNER